MENLVYVVLDDDPTGVQTVHDVPVYTSWDYASILSGFREKGNIFFVLTNSRSFSSEKTREVHREIAVNIHKAAKETSRPFVLISRGDSTLRGHFPLETEVLRLTLEKEGHPVFDGELVIPFFLEGGRITKNDIHYVIQEGIPVPAGETEFAKDKTFPYRHSDLKKWIEEKSGGKVSSSSVISLDPSRQDCDQMYEIMMHTPDFRYFIVNATSYEELQVFVNAFWKVVQDGKHYCIRSAASVVKLLAGITDVPLLERKDMVDPGNPNGGVVIVGSHVKKTTMQLRELEKDSNLLFLEFNQHLVLQKNGLQGEVERIVSLLDETMEKGKSVVVYTRRDRIDFPSGDLEGNLRLAVRISDALTSIVANMTCRPSFIVAKGGITGSDIGTTALNVKKAIVLGQIEPGIPVWKTGKESKFPGLPYVIFPGNVGNIDTLLKVVKKLED